MSGTLSRAPGSRRRARAAAGLALLAAPLACSGPRAGARTAPTTGAPAQVSPPPAPAPDVSVRSTSLTRPECVLLDVREEGAESTQRCPGIAGYQLLLLDNDSRMSVTVVDPRGRRHGLAYERVVSQYFTTLGPSAKWLIQDAGVALAVPVIAHEDPDDPDLTTAYWAIAKITPGEACVTDRLPGDTAEMPDAESALRRAVERPCLPQLTGAER